MIDRYEELEKNISRTISNFNVKLNTTRDKVVRMEEETDVIIRFKEYVQAQMKQQQESVYYNLSQQQKAVDNKKAELDLAHLTISTQLSDLKNKFSVSYYFIFNSYFFRGRILILSLGYISVISKCK